MKTRAAKPQQKTISGVDNAKPAAPLTTPVASARFARGGHLSSLAKRRATERVRVLHLICRTIAARVQQGQGATTQFAPLARRWAGKRFICDGSTLMKLSNGTIRRAWYRWVRGGREAAALHHRYGENQPRWKLSPNQQRRLIEVLPLAFTFAELHARLFKGSRRAPRIETFVRSLSTQERRTLASLLYLRRVVRATEGRFARTFRYGGAR